MNLSQLRAFCMVAQTGSVTEAARVLNRVPSGITVRIKQLEESLGCELFIRDHRQISLSPAGRRLLPHAKSLLEKSDNTIALMRGQETHGRLVIGAIDVALVDFMPRLISGLCQHKGGIELVVRQLPSEELLAMVNDGSLDLALTEGPVITKSLDSQLAYADEVVLITSSDHPPVSGPGDLTCKEVYGFRHNSSFRFRLDQWLAQHNSARLPVVEIESWHTMLACVTAGLGATLIPRSVLNTLPGHSQVRVHPLSEGARLEIYFIWRSGYLLANGQLLMNLGQRLAVAGGPVA